jgi:hypothetical protein
MVQPLVARDPGLRHTQLRTVAQAPKMDFPSYARQVLMVQLLVFRHKRVR